ncbi:Lrp/AsnC family transcriptional regulator [Parasulfitobacter algicola]|uniref:Lrp/AsnC family transcriptional regulator n=1 Tax=Parasulfitobacter algicola TaxID=2614809 RepID=A0ABX2IN73_9RHOB|nr:Lrp/AsnC family transcriptional regulator [Sulfitobacter algicola]NSX54332.1 Lrp/AsnC family transcriptional regulator [Sulfitobacter algicola]
MDTIDEQLIAALRQNGRASISELSEILKVTRSTVRARMDRLVTNGTIAGFTITTTNAPDVQLVRGMLTIKLEGRALEKVVARLRGIPEIKAIYTTHGQWDIVVEFGAKQLEDLDDMIQSIRGLDGVTDSETSVFLRERQRLS